MLQRFEMLHATDAGLEFMSVLALLESTEVGRVHSKRYATA